MNEKLTNTDYWDATYVGRGALNPVSVGGYKNLCTKAIFDKKKELVTGSQTILEVGGGGSGWIAFLASKYEDKQFSTLDFSREGNDMLMEYAAINRLNNVNVLHGDFFSKDIDKEFDMVYSHGVVEHFTDLPEVLTAHSRFLSDNGVMLTIIPNMAGILGRLTRALNKDVFDVHVSHDLISFRKGHSDAGLEVVESGYLCSNNFGVLSSCVNSDQKVKFNIYNFLTRVSKASWFFEKKVFPFPTTKWLSPYIYAISRKP